MLSINQIPEIHKKNINLIKSIYHRFPHFTEEELDSIILEVLQKLNESSPNNVSNNITKVLIKETKRLLQEPESRYRIVNYYFNRIYKDKPEDYIKYFIELERILSKYEFIISPDLVDELINNNHSFNIALNYIERRFHKPITNGEIDMIFENNTLIMCIIEYCMLNHIEIKEKQDYDQDYVYSDSVKQYLKEIGQYRRLTAEEEQELAHRYKNGDEYAREDFINCNLRLVVSIAKRYLNRGFPLQDLIQEGNCGLMVAVNKFDPDKGFRFSTSATNWIRQAITRMIAEKARVIRYPSHIYYRVSEYKRVVNKLYSIKGEKPTFEEIGKEMGLTIKQVEELYKIQYEVVSSNLELGEDGDTELEDIIVDEESQSTEDLAFKSLISESVKELFKEAKLTEREIKVVILRFGFKDGRIFTLEEIGKMYGVTRERIRQIEAKVLKKLGRLNTAKEMVSNEEPKIESTPKPTPKPIQQTSIYTGYPYRRKEPTRPEKRVITKETPKQQPVATPAPVLPKPLPRNVILLPEPSKVNEPTKPTETAKTPKLVSKPVIITPKKDEAIELYITDQFGRRVLTLVGKDRVEKLAAIEPLKSLSRTLKITEIYILILKIGLLDGLCLTDKEIQLSYGWPTIYIRRCLYSILSKYEMYPLAFDKCNINIELIRQATEEKPQQLSLKQ